MNLRNLSYAHYMEKADFLAGLIPDEKLGGVAVARKIETIIHLGACSATTESDASYLITNNYEYTRRLADFAAQHAIRMVYASSAATYGDGARGYDDDPTRLSELLPLNMYGYSKHMADVWLARREFRPSFAGLKYFNVFGPNEYHKGDMQSLVIKATRQVLTDGCIRLFKSYRADYANGEQKRDFLYVNDAARMTVHLALDNPQATGLFNCGSGVASTWLELAQAIFSALGKEARIEFIEMPESLRDRYQYFTCAPMERMAAAGFRERCTPLREAVADYVQNYLTEADRRA